MKTSIIEIVKADITTIEADAIVNAANKTLLGGSGVDGAIHWAAGPELLAECQKLKGCETGDAKITKAYRLPAKHVIHTVGPIWHDGTRRESELLRSCYINSFRLARQYNLRSIAFPAVSCGAYGFPMLKAARIALSVAREEAATGDLDRIIFVQSSDEAVRVYREAAAELGII